MGDEGSPIAMEVLTQETSLADELLVVKIGAKYNNHKKIEPRILEVFGWDRIKLGKFA